VGHFSNELVVELFEAGASGVVLIDAGQTEL
jgi:hypothetical protein